MTLGLVGHEPIPYYAAHGDECEVDLTGAGLWRFLKAFRESFACLMVLVAAADKS
jgi:hypothetical protein